MGDEEEIKFTHSQMDSSEDVDDADDLDYDDESSFNDNYMLMKLENHDPEKYKEIHKELTFNLPGMSDVDGPFLSLYSIA
jgi:hypothetical protein